MGYENEKVYPKCPKCSYILRNDKYCSYCGWVITEGYLENYKRNAQKIKNAKENNQRSRRIPKAVQREVWRRDEGRCAECGSRERLEYDHIIPFSKGGSNTVRNIELLCEKCNRNKTNKI